MSFSYKEKKFRLFNLLIESAESSWIWGIRIDFHLVINLFSFKLLIIKAALNTNLFLWPFFFEFQRLFYLTLAIFIWFLETHIYFCIWVYQALVEGYKTLSYSTSDLVPRPGIEPGAPALGARSLKPLDDQGRPYIIYFNIKAPVMFSSILEIVGSAKLIR